MQTMIDIKNIVKTYKLYDKPKDRLKETFSLSKRKYHVDFSALKGISFSVNAGDALGILGKNGSGKSTLLKMITGVLTPTSGEIRVNGKVSAILELGAGFNPEYSGRENIYLNGLMMGIDRKEMDSKIESIIQFADIGDFIEQPVKLYSSGMFARLAFAVSINVDPDILIVDEALAVGDTRFQTKCIEKMKELKSKGTTILFVSHATEQVKRFCNKAIWIKDGVIEAEGEASEIVDIYEDYMKNSTGDSKYSQYKDEIVQESIEDKQDFNMPENPDILAYINNVKISKEKIRTFDSIEVEIDYDVYKPFIEDLLIGVAIYTPNREYVFGPNTFLEKVQIPNNMGAHKIKYKIPKVPLLGGAFCVDVGLFNNEGIVCLHYKENIVTFQISNKYISEGFVYIDHKWDVVK
ncbi:ABC transporter ATP-binding protein [Paenibacillus sp. Marseille-Q4541]|uniref:ABC transporter ATP-binding protein n=1 Tax=Paenibacillus sp. Marseille-Q4541 TaxID=2831522 RepID=UPI001BAD5B88|nr:ABC transporter ATP-binding protein [Paenibacillus sp. Marseille-Q4541]